ncbi:MAG: hypothetical protein A3J07_02545 [Candidatus Doudnabacteria bacterium RIFCSPLOWO2_02_FULL_49_13]|uniref:Glycosyltransferase 2-like domain-containing protein n=1 Tax=Candidatus Doudnabacteria bacterium RIFCSPHIGHO2_12_FULL_48_16 TaxID=1817838 RepID=A0A1F5PKU1_9BACT|nr:MAG: hypothetical protein A3E29_02060 [Candidatus Doudnabacteria bacterium RIFCSPHIGHO2_12_FULL_48_16]OGF02950.1 MAG: hypothetical protein A3J07_02545 [Candidatus Doudnabacteria bacterium RIFCSPLOWO2_02_FULL_49_13]OGF03522.1 MAG: hypothetical protein A3H14_01230 [Candidatus Doudnabacteria bacterium RIFCSPLOWO2_12_FULL_49_8]
MDIAFISRTSGEKISDDLNERLDEIEKVTGHKIAVYILSGFDFDDEINKSKKLSIEIIKVDDPISPVSINSVLEYMNKTRNDPEALFIFSQETVFTTENIQALITELQNKETLLVAGYKFEIVEDRGKINQKLNDELKSYYANEDLIAYRVPWNTCAIWNYDLFKQYIGKFDEITMGRYPFFQFPVTIDGVSSLTDHKGMEDGLAIAKAASQSRNIHFKLLPTALPWKVTEDKINNHRKKLARKDYVMRNFMAMRNYSIEALEAAEVK